MTTVPSYYVVAARERLTAALLAAPVSAEVAIAASGNAAQGLSDGEERPEIAIAESLAAALDLARETVPEHVRARAIRLGAEAWRKAIGDARVEVAA